MFAFTAYRRRQTARGLIVLLLGLWAMIAVAPCTMAAPACHDMGIHCAHADGTPSPPTSNSNCEALQAADCQTRDANWLAGSTAVPNFAVLPPQPFLFPKSVLAPSRNLLPQAEHFALRLSPPLLYLQHSAFLI